MSKLMAIAGIELKSTKWINFNTKMTSHKPAARVLL